MFLDRLDQPTRVCNTIDGEYCPSAILLQTSVRTTAEIPYSRGAKAICGSVAALRSAVKTGARPLI